MFSFRSHRSTRKWMFKKKVSTIEAPPLCAKHQCELTAFDCNSWGVVACRCCVNLRPKRERGTQRDEAINRSSDLILKFLANGDDNEDFVSLKNIDKNKKNLDGMNQRFSIPVKIGDSNSKKNNTGELKAGFSEMNVISTTSSPLAYGKETSDRPPTFIYGVNMDDGEELSVYGLLGRILQDIREKSDKDLASVCLDFVKKACEEDPSLGNLKGFKSQSDEEDAPKASENKSVDATKCNIKQSRKTFTALVHLEEQEELLSVHGLLGQILQNLCEKSQESNNRVSRPISVTEYITLMRKACEEDSDLGIIEEHVKVDWRCCNTYQLTHVEDVISVTSNVNGDFAVIDKIKERVVVYHQSGEYKAVLDVSDANNTANFSPPQGIATSPCGNYHIADGTKVVKIYDINCNFKRPLEIQVQNLRPTCIAIDSQGNIVIGDNRMPVIVICTSKGVLLKEIKTLAKPHCLAVNADKIYYSDIESGKVYALDYHGIPVFTMDTLIAGIKYRATYICCDINGEVHAVLNSEETCLTPVCRFNQHGKLLSCVVRDLQAPRGMCFSVTEGLLIANGTSVFQFVKTQ